MAQTARYASKATYGSLAYDLGGTKAAPRYTPQERPLTRPQEIPSEQAGVRTRARTVAKPAQAVAPFAVIGVLCAAVLMVVVLLGYVQLTQLSSETVEYRTQLEELKTRETRLKIDYESTFNLTEVEEYAINTLGMVRASSSQIYYVGGIGEDKAVITESDGGEALAVWREIKGFFSMVLEYLS